MVSQPAQLFPLELGTAFFHEGFDPFLIVLAAKAAGGPGLDGVHVAQGGGFGTLPDEKLMGRHA